MTNYDTNKEYIQYALDILDENITSGQMIKKACKRFLDWFNRDDMYFDYEDVDKKIRFMQKLKHSKGKFAGQRFELLPYQQWITANLIGWKWKETNTRVINTALLMLSRKTGKTFYAAALMLAIIMTDGERGAEGYMISNSAAQASIAFEHAKGQCSSIDPEGQIFSRYRSEIRIPLLDSKIKILSSDTSKLDGLNPSVFIVDELHEAKTNEVINVLRTGQGMRENPLCCIISTAGFNLGEQYPLYDAWKNAKNVLNGIKEQDTLFAALYQLDDDDDWLDEEVWIKSNPTLDQTVTRKYLREQVESAINTPSNEVSIKTKNFNLWCQSETVWIPEDKIKVLMHHFDLSDFDADKYYCLIGVDLAYVDDLCVVTTLIDKEEVLYLKAFPFICKRALQISPNKDLYRQWIQKGYMILVDDDCIDFDWVVEKIKEINEIVPIGLVAYDPYQAREIRTKCRNEGIPVKAVGQGNANFHEPTTKLEQMIYKGTNIVIDDNPAILWCFGNVILKRDSKGNKKPDKQDENNKIDIIIAFIQTIKMWMDLIGISSTYTDVTVLS